MSESTLSPFVPLSFLGLTLVTVSWSSSIYNALFGKKVVAQAAIPENKKKKKIDSKDAVKEPVVKDTRVSDVIKTIVLFLSWILFLGLLSQGVGLGDGSDVFDPYKILKVTPDSSKNEIRKVYRQLSLEYHPDRLTGKPETERIAAELEFVQISKAYKTLTDEEAMNNWLEFGHPDGKRTSTISCGIPEWMTKQENASLVMIIYLIIFASFGYCIKNAFSEIFSEKEELVKNNDKKNG